MEYGLKYFVYSSISSGKKLAEVEAAIENSLAYQKIEKSLKERDGFLTMKPEQNASRDSFNLDVNDPYGTLFIDILMYHDKKHRKLDKIIEYVYKNNFYGFILVIENMRVLGDVEQIKDYYRKFRDAGIFVLCFDRYRLRRISEFSTSDFSFSRREPIEEYFRAYDLVENLNPEEKLADSRGVVPKFSKAFIESYWQYEMYKIPEHIAIQTSGLKKSPFHRKCNLYEYSDDFKTRIYYKGKEEINILMHLPKRYFKLPEHFEELERRIDASWNENLLYDNQNDKKIIEKTVDDACIELRIPSIHPVTYKRLKLRQEKGKKGIIASYNYNEDIIEKYEKYILNPENKLDEFWQKYNSGEI